MIATITLNPCIDKSTAADVFQPEAKLRCEAVTIEPGGGGINVSKALHELQAQSKCIVPTGGHNGDILKALLKKEFIDFVTIPVATETRENWIVVEKKTNNQYRFTFPGAAASPTLVEQVIQQALALGAKWVVASGSLPPGLDKTAYAQIAKAVSAAGAKCIVDTSGEALAALKNSGAYLVKPNVGELSKLLGVEKLELEEVDDAAQQLIADGYAELVAVSMGANGAWLVSKTEKHYVSAPPVKKLSTVGAGDSMVAGMTYQLAQNKPLKEVIRLGVACGSAATMNAGTQLFNHTDAWRLEKWLALKKD